MSFYAAQFKPKKTRLEWRLEMFNEYLICAIALHFAIMTDYVIDPEERFRLGWSMITLLLILLFGNYAIMIYYG